MAIRSSLSLLGAYLLLGLTVTSKLTATAKHDQIHQHRRSQRHFSHHEPNHNHQGHFFSGPNPSQSRSDDTPPSLSSRQVDEDGSDFPFSGDEGDLTRYVVPFVGTEQNSNPGNVFVGGSVPFGMAKVGLNVEGYAPAGYVYPSNQKTRGVSPLHDSGTGSSDGSYGNFCVMPVVCSNDDVDLCPTLLEPRERFRKNGSDVASPGFFKTELENGIKIELTSTRRSTLEKYTFPNSLLASQKSKQPHLVLDWTNDSPGTFHDGSMEIDWQRGRLMMNGSWLSSFGPYEFRYQAYQCVDLLAADGQALGNKAVFGGDRFGMDVKDPSVTSWQRVKSFLSQPIQAGAVVGFTSPLKSLSSSSSSSLTKREKTIMIRRGVSFKSAENACRNMEQEIPEVDFDKVVKRSKAEWNGKLSRIVLDRSTNEQVKKLFYTSFYRTFLSPNNATDDGPFDTLYPYFDGLYCSWDTFRTLFPFMSLTSPRDYADIVQNYIDGYRKDGWLPECRANQAKGFIQGGNNGVPILADFAVKYSKVAGELGVDMEELYRALTHDIDVPSPNWEYEGRQAVPFQKYGYVPFAYLDVISAGQQTREASRSLEYSFGDFTAMNVAQTLGKEREVVEKYKKSALNYVLNFNNKTKSDGFTNFVQKRYANGTFSPTDPKSCSPLDNDPNHACSLQLENQFGTYESSSWEYSFYAPHDGKGLVELLGGKETFEKRLDHFFQQGYYAPGNEPSFDCPSLYHHVGKPHKSIDRVRKVVSDNFNLTPGGVPGNDDNAAMASLLSWYLLGFYPVPGSKELLILSPFSPSYTIKNELLGDTRVKVKGFDPSSIAPIKELGTKGKKGSADGRIAKRNEGRKWSERKRQVFDPKGGLSHANVNESESKGGKFDGDHGLEEVGELLVSNGGGEAQGEEGKKEKKGKKKKEKGTGEDEGEAGKEGKGKGDPLPKPEQRSRKYVKSVKIDGRLHPSICRISFDDLFPGKAGEEREIVIEVTDEIVDGCSPFGKGVPSGNGGGGYDRETYPASLSDGGFSTP